MTADAQDDAIEMLRCRLAAEGEVFETTTHASHLLIGETRVFKLKRPIAYGYLDYSTPQKRTEAVRAELELNRKTAPSLYLGMHMVTRGPGGLELDGQGDIVDAVLEMKRFPEDCLLDDMVAKHRLTRPLLNDLAEAIVRMHENAPVREQTSAALFEGVLAVNARAFSETGLLERSPDLQNLLDQCKARYHALQTRLDRRAREGRVRRCHGDLTLRNICLLDGMPTPFDCLEFSEELATTDVLYDLAFLLMDLWHRGLKSDANWLLNRYLDRTEDEEDLPVLALFLAVRAMVRSHVAAAKSLADNSAEAWTEALSYAETATDLLRPRPQRFACVGGFSGSGKSSLAAAVAAGVGPPPGARVLSSDRIRKAFYRLPPEERLPSHAYAPDVSARVYATLIARAERILSGGGSVILDAVFDRDADRAAVEALAERVGLPLLAVWLDAPLTVQAGRIAARKNDASDATVDVLTRQRERGHGDLNWRCVDASRGLEEIIQYFHGAMAT